MSEEKKRIPGAGDMTESNVWADPHEGVAGNVKIVIKEEIIIKVKRLSTSNGFSKWRKLAFVVGIIAGIPIATIVILVVAGRFDVVQNIMDKWFELLTEVLVSIL